VPGDPSSRVNCSARAIGRRSASLSAGGFADFLLTEPAAAALVGSAPAPSCVWSRTWTLGAAWIKAPCPRQGGYVTAVADIDFSTQAQSLPASVDRPRGAFERRSAASAVLVTSCQPTDVRKWTVGHPGREENRVGLSITAAHRSGGQIDGASDLGRLLGPRSPAAVRVRDRRAALRLSAGSGA
jgi:hypothetical protein